ncbi:MAG: glutamate--tRNA ligase [Bacteroidia bacterium]|nr:glutamate--tRNA ligase [Bacteroidia bacterium]MCX7764490.1 glutamate--tRNA ligase [Bacteroidia bacterium]MDW8058337.1 glutamate--tRNA ligase [Bacteroidia bacterium]
MVVRFAPSPTGPLHIGGVRTALYNYLLARKHGGRFILRIEDTDQTRYVPGAEEYIIEALTWCGITFDEGPHIGGPHAPYRQSERKAIYAQYAHLLVEKGWAYYAFDTEEELEEMRRRFEAAGMVAPQYNAITRSYMKNSLTLPPEEVQERLQNGKYVIRFLVPRGREVRFYDEIRGWVSVHTKEMDDKVLLKSDGMPTYHLANVVDDHLMGVTHVIRGEEWLPSTPLHVLLYEAFEWEMPKFAHLPLLLRPDGGGKLSKRDGDQLGFPVFPLRWRDPSTGEVSEGYRERGFLPEGVVNYLALLGWHPSENREIFTIEELIEAFSLERVSKAGARFDFEKARWVNQQHLRAVPTARLVELIRPLWEARGLPPVSDEKLSMLIELAKERAALLPELIESVRFYYEAPTFPLSSEREGKLNPALVENLSEWIVALRELQSWTVENIEALVKHRAKSMGLPLGKVLPTLRLALTGEESGASLYHIIHVLGQGEVVRRLERFVEVYGVRPRV